jgi:hypothetical protein
MAWMRSWPEIMEHGEPHPWYGPCDGMGAAGGCSECQRLRSQEPEMKKRKALTCPKCRRVQFVVCGILTCQCYTSIPKRCKPQRWMRDGERCKCPYCGFVAHADYWFERELRVNPIPAQEPTP